MISKRFVVTLCSRQESGRVAESGGPRGCECCVQRVVREPGQVDPRGLDANVRRLRARGKGFLLGK